MTRKIPLSLISALLASSLAFGADNQSSNQAVVDAEHSNIGLGSGPNIILKNTHPDAQWFGDAGLGIFFHWSICSVNATNISWPMIPFLKKQLSSEERDELLKTKDYRDLQGNKCIVPNQYWAQAPKFNPQNYHPEEWMKAAKAAGFTYAVLTTKHHDGFALWPSAYGDFNTKNTMGGRDLVKEWVEACRNNGLKVGLYFTGPDWHFTRNYMSFLANASQKTNPDFPSLDADYNPRPTKITPEEIAAYQKAFAEMFNGQVTELLTRYGKIDMIWFDGDVLRWIGTNHFISLKEMRKLQPGIVINPRTHKAGDFATFERTLKIDQPIKTWGELCDTWTTTWSHVDNIPFRAPHYVLGNLTTCHAKNVNYLLGVGPTKNGDLVPEIYKNMAIVGEWMKVNRDAVTKAKSLPEGESASVPATALGKTRYLFVQANNKGVYAEDLLPATDVTLNLSGVEKPSSVTLTADGKPLEFSYADKKVTVQLPAAKRSTGVDVVKVEF